MAHLDRTFLADAYCRYHMRPMCMQSPSTTYLFARVQVGGADTATLNAVGNSLGNSWGLIVPLLSVYCKRRWNTYSPVFCQAALFHIAGSVLFCTTYGSHRDLDMSLSSC